MFDIAKRNEQGLLVYDREAARNFCTEKENALDDKYMEKFRELFDKHERGEISDEEYESLAEKMDNEWLEEAERLYDEEFGTQSEETSERNFSSPPQFAIA